MGNLSNLQGSSPHVAVLNDEGVVMDANPEWREFARKNRGLDRVCTVGESYLDFCTSDSERDELVALLERKRDLVSFIYSIPFGSETRWYVAVGMPVSQDAGTGAILLHIDVTAWVPREQRVTKENETEGFKLPVALDPDLIQRAVSKALVQQFGTVSTPPPARTPDGQDIDSLSPRQREVLMLIAAGKSNQDIATELSCSLNTVKRHVTALLQKLNLSNRTQAALMARQAMMDKRGNG